ncbi:hypothetical protein [Paenibacillus donghaensis]|uniref:TRASH domain-containing protein n=1 Tax=Paenibacillus donghaensis TaxID=414771 RepID=A0A2Z2KFJ5_9BACL|nr:hypothetical protein [Paenibacillus donghaensis]ASA22765.1 hypothetical protein B9T62_19350 [Paenibacillus donghaensis]
MKITEQKILVNWHGNTKQHYEELGYKFTKYGDVFEASFIEVPKSSKIKADVKCDVCRKIYKLQIHQINRAENHICSQECKYLFGKTLLHRCGICDKSFYRNKTQCDKSESGLYFCSNKCVGEYNKRQRTQNITKNCLICNSEFKVKASTYDNQITCSRKCQGLWQSRERIGEKSSNFRGGKIEKECFECKDKYFTTRHASKTSKFCSQFCKQRYWAKNIIVKESFKIAKYKGNEKYRMTKGETLPEKMVKEWLLKNNIPFLQEQGFFHKYYADFYLPNTNIIVEVFGDYWHTNPDIYGDNLIQPNEHQIAQVEKDRIRIETFNKYGFKVIVLWEHEIYENIESLLKSKIITIYPRNDYTQSI